MYGVDESSSENKGDSIESDDICKINFIAALKVTYTLKSASKTRINLLKLWWIRKRKETGLYQI